MMRLILTKHFTLSHQIEYSIVPGTNGSGLFGVNQTKEGFAEIYIKQSLIDNVGLYLLTIMAEDKGAPPLNSTLDLSIFVIDENQNYPIFVHPDQTKFNTSAGIWPEIKILEVRVFFYTFCLFEGKGVVIVLKLSQTPAFSGMSLQE